MKCLGGLIHNKKRDLHPIFTEFMPIKDSAPTLRGLRQPSHYSRIGTQKHQQSSIKCSNKAIQQLIAMSGKQLWVQWLSSGCLRGHKLVSSAMSPQYHFKGDVTTKAMSSQQHEQDSNKCRNTTTADSNVSNCPLGV